MVFITNGGYNQWQLQSMVAIESIMRFQSLINGSFNQGS